jgi:predicted membrane protein
MKATKVTKASPAPPAPSRIHLPSLAVAILIMLVATLYPPLMVNATGKVDHGLMTALFFAMSAGFVRGVGFVPQACAWRWLFSSWSCMAALTLALSIKFLSAHG